MRSTAALGHLSLNTNLIIREKKCVQWFVSLKSILNEINVQRCTGARICLDAQKPNHAENLVHLLQSLAYCELLKCFVYIYIYNISKIFRIQVKFIKT